MQAASKPDLVQRTKKFVPLIVSCVGFAAWGLYQLQIKQDLSETQPKCVTDPETRGMAMLEKERMDKAAARP